MKKYILLVMSMLFTLSAFSQIVKPGELFTQVNAMEGKVVLMKEINTNLADTAKTTFDIVKKWALDNYSKDHFHSSIRLDPDNKEITIISRIDLVLPSKGTEEREKVTMKYRLNCFIFKEKCIVEAEKLEFINKRFKDSKVYKSRVVGAEEMITEAAIGKNDVLKEMRGKIKKNTLFFFNQIGNELEMRYGNPNLMVNGDMLAF